MNASSKQYGPKRMATRRPHRTQFIHLVLNVAAKPRIPGHYKPYIDTTLQAGILAKARHRFCQIFSQCRIMPSHHWPITTVAPEWLLRTYNRGSMQADFQ